MNDLLMALIFFRDLPDVKLYLSETAFFKIKEKNHAEFSAGSRSRMPFIFNVCCQYLVLDYADFYNGISEIADSDQIVGHCVIGA